MASKARRGRGFIFFDNSILDVLIKYILTKKIVCGHQDFVKEIIDFLAKRTRNISNSRAVL